MEQDLKVYEFRLNSNSGASSSAASPQVESYSFEAPSHAVAETYRPYAMIHFREILGQNTNEAAITGPYLVVPKSGLA